jgi:hypothetical protein
MSTLFIIHDLSMLLKWIKSSLGIPIFLDKPSFDELSQNAIARQDAS